MPPIATEPEPVTEKPNVPPVAQTENPSSGKLEDLQKTFKPQKQSSGEKIEK